jgi:hypothetical protein
MRRLALGPFLLAVACASSRGDATAAASGHADLPAAAQPAPAPAPNKPSAPDPSPAVDAGAAMTSKNVRDKLPSQFDVRVQRALGAPLADDVVIALDHVAMAKSPNTNYRYTLTRDGALFYVQHSTKPGDWQVPFDQPLPTKPSTRVDAAKVDALVAELTSAGFFDHPGYEADPQTEDGSYWIVRARRGKDVHAVVFQNVQPPYLADLTSLSDPLWTQK